MGEVITCDTQQERRDCDRQQEHSGYPSRARGEQRAHGAHRRPFDLSGTGRGEGLRTRHHGLSLAIAGGIRKPVASAGVNLVNTR